MGLASSGGSRIYQTERRQSQVMEGRQLIFLAKFPEKCVKMEGISAERGRRDMRPLPWFRQLVEPGKDIAGGGVLFMPDSFV